MYIILKNFVENEDKQINKKEARGVETTARSRSAASQAFPLLRERRKYLCERFRRDQIRTLRISKSNQISSFVSEQFARTRKPLSLCLVTLEIEVQEEMGEDQHNHSDKGFFQHLAGFAGGHYPPHGHHGYGQHGHHHGYGAPYPYPPPPPPYGYPPVAYPPHGGYPPAGYPPHGYPSHGYPGLSHSGHHHGGIGAIIAGGAAAVAAAASAHHMSHHGHYGHHHGHGYGYGHHGHGKFKHGKFKHGKFGKRWKHGMFGKHKGKFFKKWK